METANPIVIVLLFVLRCLVPLLIMLAISYILRRLGFIRDLPPPPEESNGVNNGEGGLVHGKV